MSLIPLFKSLLPRSLIAGTGIGLGLITVIPNIMLCADGTKPSILTAEIGCTASGSWILGGLVGAVTKHII